MDRRRDEWTQGLMSGWKDRWADDGWKGRWDDGGTTGWGGECVNGQIVTA